MVFSIAKFYEEQFLQREIFDYYKNYIAKEAFTECSWRGRHQGPAAQNRQFSTESPDLLTFFLYEYKGFFGHSSGVAEHFQT